MRPGPSWGKKDKHCDPDDPGDAEQGSFWDHVIFDPETKLVFCSCGDGTVAVFHEDGPDKYTLVETVKTKTGSKTMALDTKTHNLFIPAAKFKPAAPNARPTMEPGTFSVQVYGK